MNDKTETTVAPIKQAAIMRDGQIWTLPRPARHHNIIWAMNDVDGKKEGQIIPAHGIQGFIDEQGKFLERPVAAIRAQQCGQLIKPLIAPPNLFSEDLW